MDDYKYQFKIVLVGDAGVGKTCLVRQFTQGNMPTDVQGGATIGVDFMIRNVVANGLTVRLQLWDTAGQERFRSITQSYYRSAHCLILVYDISSQPSFDALSRWMRDVEAVLERDTQLGSDVLRVLVGNKCDKEREVPISIGERFADINKFDLFMETSALDNESVDRLFNDVAEMLTIKKKNEPINNQITNSDQILSANSINASGGDPNGTFSPVLGFMDSIGAMNAGSRARSCLQC